MTGPGRTTRTETTVPGETWSSYLVGDEDAGVAAVVDPKLEIEEYLALG